MPRKKSYEENVVLAKAKDLIWREGYENVSSRDLEKHMGINLFSIYSNFTNKEGVLLASIKIYKLEVRTKLIGPLSTGTKIDDIKNFFESFLSFTFIDHSYRGCLLINTASQFTGRGNKLIDREVHQFSQEIWSELKRILELNNFTEPDLIRSTNYLFSSLIGLVTTAKMMETTMIEDTITTIFENI